MTKQKQIQITRMHKDLVRLIWEAGFDDQLMNENSFMMATLKEHGGYECKLIKSTAELDGIKLNFFVISNESDDQGWMFVHDLPSLTNFYEEFSTYDLGEGVVIVYLPQE